MKRFNSEAFVKKTSNEKNGVLYHRGQILEGQQFIVAGGFEDLGPASDHQFTILHFSGSPRFISSAQ